ncbi:Nop53 (60S ribosomal biogenesis), putative [Angomonas deanei]|uniref:Ribosome biogenesis protein NOP53 n=1 Tax=Angomonas deanei TaxID=59799 RepID=A0A7G2CAK7_9TRYP|nr:Nop53 (60S ribosomal biogenesis), putative [Angomonas deanei]
MLAIRMGKKLRDLWTDGGKTKAINKPTKQYLSKGWAVTPDILPAKPDGPRRRKYAPIRPNKREAVAVPLSGQSYNPSDADHQDALRKVVRKLTKKEKKNEKFVKLLEYGRDQTFEGNFSADKNWEEEVKETKPKEKKAPLTPEIIKKEESAAKKKDKRRKKLGKLGTAREARRSLLHRRHPSQAKILKEAEVVDELLKNHMEKEAKREVRVEQRKLKRKEDTLVKHYGRHYYQGIAPDVAPSDKLVGSLRHMEGGYVHPALDRMKSLEERNLVPARMNHKYNKRKILKPKGEMHLKREDFGVLPHTTF